MRTYMRRYCNVVLGKILWNIDVIRNAKKCVKVSLGFCVRLLWTWEIIFWFQAYKRKIHICISVTLNKELCYVNVVISKKFHD